MDRELASQAWSGFTRLLLGLIVRSQKVEVTHPDCFGEFEKRYHGRVSFALFETA